MAYLRRCNNGLRKKAKYELNENYGKIDEYLRAFKEWIEMTPHLRARTDDQFLVTFLRGCKYNLKRAQNMLEMYYTVRIALPEIMLGRNPQNKRVLDVIRLGVGLPLPLTERPDSPRVLLIRPGAYDATMFDLLDIMKVANMICDIMLIEDDNFVIAGNITLVDFQDVTKAHLMQLDPYLAKKLAMLNQEASPVIQKSTHFLNTPPGFGVVFNLFKNMMTSRNAGNMEAQEVEVFIHGNSHETLYDHIPKRILPKEYGGECGTITDIIQHWEHKLTTYQDYFSDDEKYGTDETIRPAEYINRVELLSAENSF